MQGRRLDTDCQLTIFFDTPEFKAATLTALLNGLIALEQGPVIAAGVAACSFTGGLIMNLDVEHMSTAPPEEIIDKAPTERDVELYGHSSALEGRELLEDLEPVIDTGQKVLGLVSVIALGGTHLLTTHSEAGAVAITFASICAAASGYCITNILGMFTAADRYSRLAEQEWILKPIETDFSRAAFEQNKEFVPVQASSHLSNQSQAQPEI